MRKGAIILFKNGYCYQSYGWNILRPLGEIQNVLDHLEKYEVDEISIIRPLKGFDSDKSFYSDLEKLSKIKSSTPISFGGGLYDLNRIKSVRSLSFERLIFSSHLFSNDLKILKKTSNLVGKQAIVGCLPLKFFKNKLMVYNSMKNKFSSFKELNNDQLEMCDEFIVYDCLNEGGGNSFDIKILNDDFFYDKKIIIAGGTNKDMSLLTDKNIASILIENRILHNEYSLKR